MRTSKSGIKKLLLREDIRLTAYMDNAGVWTIGVGHTGVVRGRPVHRGMVITEQEAADLYKEDIKVYEDVVKKWVKVPLKQYQFDCLVSFVFNIGEPQFITSTLLRLLNNKEYNAVPVQLMRWNKITHRGTKVVSNGLTYRRVAECAQWYERRIGREYE